MVCNDVEALVQYGIDKALIAVEDRVWARNQLLAALSLDGFAPEDGCVALGKSWTASFRAYSTTRSAAASSPAASLAGTFWTRSHGRADAAAVAGDIALSRAVRAKPRRRDGLVL